MPELLAVAIFLSVTAVVLAVHRVITAPTRPADRLRTLAPARAPRVAPAHKHPLRRLLASLAPLSLAGDEDGLARQLSVAGLRSPSALPLFLGTRTLLSVGPALVLLVPRVAAGQPLGRALLVGGAGFLVGHLGCSLWLRRRAERRTFTLRTGLPDCLDLMVVSLEAGLGLNATIARVGEERSGVDDALGREFAQVAQEMRQGASREDALRRLGTRNGVDELSALATLIIQSDRLGASMAKTLRAHADVLRVKRQQRAEEMARKLPVKMLFPLAIFILPPLFVVTLGPAMLRLGDFVKVMSGR